MSRNLDWMNCQQITNTSDINLNVREVWQVTNTHLNTLMSNDRTQRRGKTIASDVVKLTKTNGCFGGFEVVKNARAQFRHGIFNRQFRVIKLLKSHGFEVGAVIRQGFADAAQAPIVERHVV